MIRDKVTTIRISYLSSNSENYTDNQCRIPYRVSHSIRDSSPSQKSTPTTQLEWGPNPQINRSYHLKIASTQTRVEQKQLTPRQTPNSFVLRQNEYDIRPSQPSNTSSSSTISRIQYSSSLTSRCQFTLPNINQQSLKTEKRMPLYSDSYESSFTFHQ